MPKLKIGEAVTAKIADVKQYYTIGIAKTTEGYEVRKLKVHGLEITVRNVLLRTTERAEAMQRLRVEVSQYIVSFNEGETSK